jgi:hypothetical protein
MVYAFVCLVRHRPWPTTTKQMHGPHGINTVLLPWYHELHCNISCISLLDPSQSQQQQASCKVVILCLQIARPTC